MRAGILNELITIQRKTTTLSDAGEPEETWSTIAARRAASVRPVRGEERFGGEQLVARQQTEFRIHYSADVAALTPLDRVVYPALSGNSPPDDITIYDILAVHQIGFREGLQLLTVRRSDTP